MTAPGRSDELRDAPPQGTTGGSWPMLVLAWLAYFYFGAMAASFAPTLLRIQDDLGLSGAQSGLLLAAYPFAYVLLSFWVGTKGDQLGVRLFTALGLLVLAGSMLLRATAHSFPHMLFAALLLGVGGPVISTVLPRLVSTWFSGATRRLAVSIYVTGPVLGGGVVLTVTPLLLDAFGSWRGVFAVYGLFGGAVAAVWLVATGLIERLHRPPAVAVESPAMLDSAGAVQPVWRKASVWAVALGGIAMFAVGQGFSSWLPSILEADGASPTRASLWASLARYAALPGSIGLGWLASRVPTLRRVPMLLVMFVVTSASVLTVLSGDSSLTLVALLVQGFVNGATLPLLLGLLIDLPDVAPSQTGSAAGLFFTVGQSAGALAPTATGALHDLTGSYDAGIVMVAVLLLVAMFPVWRIPEQIAPRPTG